MFALADHMEKPEEEIKKVRCLVNRVIKILCIPFYVRTDRRTLSRKPVHLCMKIRENFKGAILFYRVKVIWNG